MNATCASPEFFSIYDRFSFRSKPEICNDHIVIVSEKQFGEYQANARIVTSNLCGFTTDLEVPLVSGGLWKRNYVIVQLSF